MYQYHYDSDNNNSYCILHVYLYIIVGLEYERLPEALHLVFAKQMFLRFVSPEG